MDGFLRGTRSRAPAVLVKFLRERRFWMELGIPARPLDERDWCEVEEYEDIMLCIDRYRESETRLAQERLRGPYGNRA